MVRTLLVFCLLSPRPVPYPLSSPFVFHLRRRLIVNHVHEICICEFNWLRDGRDIKEWSVVGLARVNPNRRVGPGRAEPLKCGAWSD